MPPPAEIKPLSDIELMLRVRGGDLDAFETLARRWRKPLLGFFQAVTWNMDDAEDFVQATLLRLWRFRGGYSPCGKFSTYVFQIAKRHWLNEAVRAQVATAPLETAEGLPGLTFADYSHPVGHLLSRYRDERVGKAIVNLPETQRLALALCHFEGLSQREASEILEIPLGTVKSRLAAAFASLRQRLGDLVEGD